MDRLVLDDVERQTISISILSSDDKTPATNDLMSNAMFSFNPPTIFGAYACGKRDESVNSATDAVLSEMKMRMMNRSKN
jgi:hypothetical protein